MKKTAQQNETLDTQKKRHESLARDRLYATATRGTPFFAAPEE